jgi:hypothetical protein
MAGPDIDCELAVAKRFCQRWLLVPSRMRELREGFFIWEDGSPPRRRDAEKKRRMKKGIHHGETLRHGGKATEKGRVRRYWMSRLSGLEHRGSREHGGISVLGLVCAILGEGEYSSPRRREEKADEKGDSPRRHRGTEEKRGKRACAPALDVTASRG